MLICSHCMVEMRPYINGVNVIEYASFGPYKIYYADEVYCPNCLRCTITGFGPPLAHHEKGFAERLAEAVGNKELLRYSFESQTQRRKFMQNSR